MRFQAALFVAIATIFVAEWQPSGGYYVSIAKVPVENGKCQYNGTEITPGAPIKVDTSCEEWDCSSDGHLSIAGCGHIICNNRRGLVKGTGVFPHCCVHLECS
uniref:Putative conserved secreted protein n=1 Tax=Amblyomma tuberculatum TaxID=48802 RepID=A0A6M2E101_9ACAR